MARKDTTTDLNILVLHFRTENTEADIRDRLVALCEQGHNLRPVHVPSYSQTSGSALDLLHDVHGVVIMGASDLYFDGACDASDMRKCEALRVRNWLAPLVAELAQRDMPTLAFCFGHQLFADVLGGSVAHCTETGKVGTHTVTKTDAGKVDDLLAHVPDTFAANYVHKDVVTTAPPTATLLAHGERCHNAMLRYGTNIYTTQFHPELRRDHLVTLLAKHDDYLRTEHSTATQVVEEIVQAIQDTPHAAVIVGAFGERVGSRIA